MISKKFFKFFPVPKYLSPPIAGLSISDNHMRLVYIKETSKSCSLQKYKEIELPKGVIVSGDIIDKEKVISLLEGIRKECGISNVRTSIPEEKAYLFELEIPLVKAEEIKNLIEFKLEENVPLPASEIIFDYSIVGQTENSLHIIVSALPRQIVELYEEVLVSAGFSLYAIEIESQAITKAVIKDKSNYLLIHFSKEKASVYVVKNMVVHFTSTFSIFGDNKTTSIPKEIGKVIHYWKDNYVKGVNDNLSEILICGDIDDFSIVDQISFENNLKTTIANPWQNVFDLDKYIPPIKKIDSIRYVSSIGLAIPQNKLII